MEGLNLLGAELASQFITLRIKHIDREKLKQKLGGASGTLAQGALTLVDMEAKAALDMVVPVVRSKLKNDYGVDADIVVSNVPPSQGGRALSEFWPGLLVGGAVGVSGFAIWNLVRRLVGR